MKIVKIIGVLVFCYSSVAFGVYLGQRSLLYSPQPIVEPVTEKEIELQSAGVNLRGWVLNEGQEKAIIYFGGTAEEVSLNVDLFKRIFSDHTVYLINYRGFGKSEGSPTESDLYQDALTIYDHVLSKHASAVVMGRSLGSGVATYLAVNRKVEKLILVTPYDSVEHVAQAQYPFLPVSLMLRDKYESWKRAKDIKIPTLIVMAENDETVSRERTEYLIANFVRDNLRIVEVPGSSHRVMNRFPTYHDALVKFLAGNL